jgi:hypothetical protein
MFLAHNVGFKRSNGQTGPTEMTRRPLPFLPMSITGPHPEADELQRLYVERFSGRTEYRNEVWKILSSEFFSTWIPESSTILDLGAGYCEFINNVRARRKLALDLNPDAKSSGQHRRRSDPP